MKHRVKMNVVTQKKGLFGTRNGIKEKTVTVSGKEDRKSQQEKRKAEDLAKAQKMAAMFVILEEEIAEEFGEDF